MRIVMVMKWDGITPEQYDKVRKLADWEGTPAEGGVFHVAGFSENALRVTDVWESADDFNNFVQTRLMPAVATAGIKSEPKVEIFPAYAIYVPALQRLS